MPEGVTRLIQREAQSVLQSLTSRKGSAEERFHQARKRLKKIRAILRLVRDEIGETVFARENAAFRDVARHLSEVRDAQVLPETLDGLLEHFDEPAERFAAMRAKLAAAAKKRTDMRKARIEIRSAIERIGDYGIEHDGWKSVKDGLKATYAQSRARFLAAYATPSDIHFHEWRKSVKYLRHHIDLLSLCWEKPLEELSDQLHDLSDCLGKDHDLAVLRDRIDGPHADLVLALIARRQAELRAAAEPLARRLFAEKPGAFTRRIREYWDAWHEPIRPTASPQVHLASHA